MIFYKKMVEAQALVAPAATNKRGLVTVRDLASGHVIVKAYFLNRFEDPGMFVDVAAGKPRVANETVENFRRNLVVRERNQANDIVPCAHSNSQL